VVKLCYVKLKKQKKRGNKDFECPLTFFFKLTGWPENAVVKCVKSDPTGVELRCKNKSVLEKKRIIFHGDKNA